MNHKSANELNSFHFFLSNHLPFSLFSLSSPPSPSLFSLSCPLIALSLVSLQHYHPLFYLLSSLLPLTPSLSSLRLCSFTCFSPTTIFPLSSLSHFFSPTSLHSPSSLFPHSLSLSYLSSFPLSSICLECTKWRWPSCWRIRTV